MEKQKKEQTRRIKAEQQAMIRKNLHAKWNGAPTPKESRSY